MAVHFHTLKVKEVKKQTPDCVSIEFAIPPDLQEVFAFNHGQNITIKKMMGGEEIRRSYSICTAPFENKLSVAVKKVDNGKFSSFANLDLKAGDEVQLMLRSINLDYIEKGITSLNLKAKANPLYYFYINCAGRAKPYAGGILEDVEEVQKLIGHEVPFMGFYSGVEVAKLGDHLQALDWTGVLCLLTEDE